MIAEAGAGIREVDPGDDGGVVRELAVNVTSASPEHAYLSDPAIAPPTSSFVG